MTTSNDLPLPGLDGGNPLAFLAALGTLHVSTNINPQARLRWECIGSRLSPVLSGLGCDADEAVSALHSHLHEMSVEALEINDKLPFAATEFRDFLLSVAREKDCRSANFGCAFGSEVYVRESDNTFDDTQFRMVRSGDAAGNGLLAYAAKIRKLTTLDCLKRTLLYEWDYADGPPGFRWDPVGDVPYAYGWSDPSKTAASMMTGANSLAIEGLLMFPTIPGERKLQTTAFHRFGRDTYLTWPLWSAPVTCDVVRSLLTLPELADAVPHRQTLAARSIIEVYRCRRYASSQYYSNFSPAESV
ncbi:MAG: hypothetical protein RIK87_03055 [Fuerstiella sp.]